jgi:hypothetical protein
MFYSRQHIDSLAMREDTRPMARRQRFGTSRQSAIIVLVLTLAFGAACGDPPSADGGFEFEPEPVKTLEDGTAILANASPSCGSVLADEVGALVDNEHYADFENWIHDYPFEIVDESPGRNGFLLRIRVPLGAPSAAVDLIQQQEGVIAVNRQGIGRGEHPCTTL